MAMIAVFITVIMQSSLAKTKQFIEGSVHTS